ncbi:MAG: imidazole glycerol phosphate synthase subunit HisH [Planctomycetota bacterium]|jgi:glutamine amidotransferase
MLAIIDYNAGNLTSVELAVKQVGGEPLISSDPDVIRKAERVIFPGVGAASSCMDTLNKSGIAEALKEVVAAGKPVLAICIGIQLLFDFSEEDGGVDCLGILKGKIRKFSFPEGSLQKIPHMGWNAAALKKEHVLLSDLEEKDEFYFVHSYYPEVSDQSIILAETEYGGFTFSSAVNKENLIATQFHPEKSGRAGLSILKNFTTWSAE